MIKYFLPKSYVASFDSLNLALLKAQGIQLIICDVDNTLVAHNDPLPSAKVFAFINQIKQMNMEIVLISNNNLNRVQAFAQQLELSFYASAKKPLRKTYQQILSDYQLKTSAIAALGDQLLTDILGANRMGMFSILTNPLDDNDLSYTKINRWIERRIMFILKLKYRFQKGEYYETL